MKGTRMILHVGIDDTDSEEGMCTTYVGAVIIEKLKGMDVEHVGCPSLIRLNPNWIHKTRGNCSVALTLEVERDKVEEVKDLVLEEVEELAELHIEETTPGVVFLEGEEISTELKTYSKKVVREVVTMEEAEKLGEGIGAEMHKFRFGRGVIGALAAIGHSFEEDHTYELIAYRKEENWGTPRRIDEDSVRKMNEATFPRTFDNLDLETGEVQIAPHTPCPILYGIRSEDPESAFEAYALVEEGEPVELVQLYRTNQGTDEHLQEAKIAGIEPFESVIVTGRVSRSPETREGGHVFFSIEDETGEVDCAAFEPTKRFREVIRSLVPGDGVRVYGGAKEKANFPLTVNLEKIEILELETVEEKHSPICGNCGKRMTSAGKDKGYVCKNCGEELPPGSEETVEMERELEERVYEVPPSARRHLAKPISRSGKKKANSGG